MSHLSRPSLEGERAFDEGLRKRLESNSRRPGCVCGGFFSSKKNEREISAELKKILPLRNLDKI